MMSWNKVLLYFGVGICLLSSINNLNAENGTDEDYAGWGFVAPEIKEKCDSVKNSVILYRLDPKVLESLKGCDADALYYGFDQAPDYIKALACAQATMSYDVLTMLYANGKGVNRNLDIAIHYACKFGGAPAELEGRVKHLMELQTTGKKEKDFDICDDITSGYMMGQCAAIESRFKDAKRQKEYAPLTANFTPEEHKEFKKLQKAFEAYLADRMGEIDVSGTARASLQIGEENSLRDRFLETLEACIQGKISTFIPKECKIADKQLNALYKKALATRYSEYSGINKKNIQKTQRTWLKYRDAWIAFGRLKCPSITVDSWRTLFTKERTKELQTLTEMDF